MSYTPNNQTSTLRSRRGTSLVEVLVALVLLVVGIYSIARLFPGGFFSIRSAQNNTFADRLAQGQLEQLKQNNSFLLDAVYMYTPGGAFVSSYSPTDLTDDYPNIQNPNAAYDNIDKARYISGEQFTVPGANTSTANGETNGVSLHVLNDGPAVFVGQITDPSAPAAVRGLPPVHSGPWTPKIGVAYAGIAGATGSLLGGANLPSDLLGSGGAVYAIDYQNQRIALPAAAYVQHFTLALRVMVTPTTGSSPAPVVATYYIPLLIPAADNTGTDSATAYDGGWFDPTADYQDTARLTATGGMVSDIPGAYPLGASSGYQYLWGQNSASLTRSLAAIPAQGSMLADRNYLLNASGPTNPDPYTYYVYSNDPALTTVNLGVLAINPLLSGQDVSVSYLAYDWHIVHEDDDVPTATETPIHLTVDHVKRAGSVQNDETIYPGLFRSADVAAASDYDIVVLDTDTGQSIGLNVANDTGSGGAVYDLDNQNGPTANNQPDRGSFRVSYQNGYITLPAVDTNAATMNWAMQPHQHLRIFYEGDYDWAVALQKAPSLYTRASLPAAPNVLGAGQYALVQTGSGLHLKFPPSDMGQTVEVDDIRYTDTHGASQEVSTATGTVSSDFQDTLYVDIGQYLPNANFSQPITVGAVRGVSARSVVVWKERGQWKSRSINTILGNGQ